MAIPPPGTPIILDIGSAYVKVGFAGEPYPRYNFPCMTGTEKYKAVMVDVGARNIYIGDDAMKMRGVLKVSHPIERGAVMDWNDFYEILNHIFYSLLRIENLSYYPVFYIEAPFVPTETKEYIARVLYETHRVNSLINVPSPILSCFSVGLTTGLVIESGHGTTWIAPILFGKIVHQAVQRLNLAGMDVSNNLKALLMREGINITSSAVDEIIKEIKERNCYYVLDVNNPPQISGDEYSYDMPDGASVNIPAHILYEAPEIMFQPRLMGSQSVSIAQAVINSLQSIDKQYWGDLLSHIVLSGGNLMHAGFEERFRLELESLLSQIGPIPKSRSLEPEEKLDIKAEIKDEIKKLQILSANQKINDTCPQCGTLVDLSEGLKRCSSCGASLSLPQLPIEIEMNELVKCKHCNKEIKDLASKFCPYCGQNIEPLDTPKISEEKLAIETASEFSDFYDDSESIIYFFIPDNLQQAIFNGAAILGSLPSFQQLFITHDQFLSDTSLLYKDISEIF
jgi:actin beta/gamma 1